MQNRSSLLASCSSRVSFTCRARGSYGALRHPFPTLRHAFPSLAEPVHHRPVGPAAIKVGSGARSDHSGRLMSHGSLSPGGSGRSTRASAHAAAALMELLPTPASPAGGAGTARPRPSEREPEVIFVVLSVRSRRAVGTHVSPAMWQPIFFTNDGAALHLCLPVLACERAC